MKKFLQTLALVVVFALPFASVTKTHAQNCQFSVEMTDSYGDGWNGSIIAFYQNGTLLGSASLSGGPSGTQAIMANSTDSIAVVFSYEGMYTDEASFVIRNGAGTIVISSVSLEDFTEGDTIARFLNACPNCIAPAGFAVAAVEGSDLTLTWNSGNATSWQLVYGVSGFDIDSIDDSQIEYVIDTTYTLYGLNDTSRYDFYLRTDCGDETSTWVSILNQAVAQEYLMTLASDTIRSCGWVIYDNGGANGNYTSNCNQTLVVLADDETHTIMFSGTSYTEGTYDYLTIYDGIGTTGEVLFDDYGISATTTIGPFVAESGAITITFQSDGSVQYSGFEISTTCVDKLSCGKPQGLHATLVASDSINVEWIAGDENAWVLSINDSLVEAYDTSYLFEYLTPNTDYTISVATLCGSDTSAWSNPIHVRTACGEQELPFTETFDSYNGEIPSCWNMSEPVDDGWGNIFPYVYSYGSPHSGTYDLLYYPYYGSASIASPRLTQAISTIETAFFAKAGAATGYQVVVGFTTNLDSVSNMIVMDTLDLTDAYQEYIVSFRTLTDINEPGYIIYKVPQNSGYHDVYLDDITIRETGICAMPYDFVCTGNGDGQVSLSWADTLGSAWEIVYDTTGFTINDEDSFTSASEDSITITGLDNSVTYDFWVRTDCGGEYSYWLGPVTVRPNTYNMHAFGNDTISLCGGTIYDNGGATGNYSNNSNSTLVIYPTDTTMGISLSGTIHTEGSNFDYMEIYDGAGTDGTLLFTNQGGSSSSVTPVDVTATGHAITLHFVSDASVNYEGWELMVNCFDFTCPMISNLAVDNVTDNSATLSWTDSTASNSYAVRYHTSPVSIEDTVGTLLSANTNSITITGLNPATTYYFTVASDCGGTYGYAMSTSVRTNCTGFLAIPYTTDFEDLTTGQLPSCWDALQTGSSSAGTFPAAYEYSNNALNGNVYFEFENSSVQPELVALPAVDSLEYLQLTFWAQNPLSYYGVNCEVGVMEGSTFVPVATIPVSNTYTEHTVYFGSYTGTGNRMAIRASGVSYSYTLFIDSLTISYAPTCTPVTDVHSTGNTFTTVDLAWTENSHATTWEVGQGSATDAPVSGDITTSNPYTATGLTAGQDYYYYVRNICSATDTGDWVGPVHVVPGTYEMRHQQSDTITMCGGVILDDGGLSGDYSNNANDILVVRPSAAGLAVNLQGSYNTESGWDTLFVFEGEGLTGTRLCAVSGIGTINVTSEDSTGSLTIRFKSDASSTRAGYALTANCVSNTCPSVTGLEVLSATTSTITLDWTSRGTESEWEVMNQTTGTSAFTTSHPYTVDNLEESHTYTLMVRPVCGEGDTGAWATIITQTEMCDNPEYAVFGNQSDSVVLGTLQGAPVNGYYNYGISEIILDSADLGGAQDFVAVNFHYNYSQPLTSKTDVEIYIMPTSRTSFVDEDDYDNIDASAVLVYSGALNAEQGWNTFLFDTPYSYDGNGNLMMIVNDLSGDYDGSSYNWTMRPDGSGVKTIAIYRDDSAYTATNIVVASWDGGNSWYGRPEMQLIACGDACSAPAILSHTKNYESITLTWSGNSTDYEVSYKAVSDLNWSAEVAVSGNTYTFSGLYPSTEYDVRVRALCGDDATSRWIVRAVTTDSLPCFVVTNVRATATTESSMTLAWDNAASSTAQSWVINVFNATSNFMDTVSTNPATISGLYDNTEYSVSIQSMCSALIYSDWSDTITVRTATCQPVTGVAVSNVTGSSANLTWNGTASEYEINWGLEGFPQGTGSTAIVSSNSYVITGLEEFTSYDVYVRAKCGDDVVSAWSTKVNFVTTNTQGIDGVEGNYNLSIYPNPTSGNTTISLSGVEGMVTISVVDINGRTVSSEELNCGIDCEKHMDVSNLAQGTYFVRVLGEGINSVRKLVVR